MLKFLDQFALHLLKQPEPLSAQLVLVPNRRSAFFIRQALLRNSPEPLIAPAISTINDWMYHTSAYRSANSVSLLFYAYEAYSRVFGDHADTLERFSKWGRLMLADFSELDAQLAPAQEVLEYLADVRRLETWNLESKTTGSLEQYLEQWHKMPQVYKLLRERLQQLDLAYQGMAYREVAEQCDSLPTQLGRQYSHLHWVGFNVWSAAEKKVFQALSKNGLSQVYWDLDLWYLNQPHHEAGRAIYKQQQFDLAHPDKLPPFLGHYLKQGERHMESFALQGVHQQVSTLYHLLQDLPAEEYADTAVLLADEQLLVPLLQMRPTPAPPFNVTMGLPLLGQPLTQFFQSLVTGACAGHEMAKGYPWQQWERWLSYPALPFLIREGSLSQLERALRQMSAAHFTPAQVTERSGVTFHPLLLEIWAIENLSTGRLFEALRELCLVLKPHFKEGIARETLYQMHELCRHFADMISRWHTHLPKGPLVEQLFVEALHSSSLNLQGEPLQGIQVMGVLESRNLDFKNIFFLSFNEGVIPAGQSGEGFIPFEVKQKYALDTVYDRDAIYAYYFYRLLHRAQKVYLLYDQSTEGLRAGEASRYLWQVEKELVPAFSNWHYQARHIATEWLTPKNEAPAIPKSPAALKALEEKSLRGWSYSALQQYLANPRNFYFQQLIGLQPLKRRESRISPQDMGDIVHAVLEGLYQPWLEKPLSAEASFYSKPTTYWQEALHETYRRRFYERDFSQGADVLQMEQMCYMIQRFLKREQQFIQGGAEIKVHGLEVELKAQLRLSKGRTVILKGLVDRIDLREQVWHLIDYKTGSLDPDSFKISDLAEVLEKEKKHKALQLLIYAYLFFENYLEAQEVRPALISLRKGENAWVPLLYKGRNYLKREDMQKIEPILAEIVSHLLDPEKNFESEPPFGSMEPPEEDVT